VYLIHVSGVAASPQFIMIKDSVFWGAFIPLDYVFFFGQNGLPHQLGASLLKFKTNSWHLFGVSSD
jgi:hypothetical protein